MSAIVNKLNDLLSILNDGNKTEKERANAIGFTVPQYRMFMGFIKQARSNARKMDKDVPGAMPKPETGKEKV